MAATETDERVDEDLIARADAEGKTIEELAAELGDSAEAKPTPPTQLAIPGTRDKIGGSFGGKIPSESELRLLGGRRPIIGSFDKGERIQVLVNGTIRAVEGIDIDDEWGNVQRTVRAHKARMLEVQVVTPALLMTQLVNLGMSKQEVGILYEEVASA